jgi:hypothetical protein
MQSFLTEAAVVVELLGASYIAGSFVIYARHRFQESTHRRFNTTFTTVDPVPPERSETTRKLTPTERLRQQCQQAGIKWRHAHGKNKHLKKAEMIAALQQLEREKRSASTPRPAIHPVPTNPKAA